MRVFVSISTTRTTNWEFTVCTPHITTLSTLPFRRIHPSFCFGFSDRKSDIRVSDAFPAISKVFQLHQLVQIDLADEDDTNKSSGQNNG